jgi:hypothetical protein
MTTTQARIALERFFAACPDLDEWRRNNFDECMARGYVKIGVGRVVEAAWEPFGLSFPQCSNLPIQGICADAMLRAITWTYSRLNRAGIRGGLVACVHDADRVETLFPTALAILIGNELLSEVPEAATRLCGDARTCWT